MRSGWSLPVEIHIIIPISTRLTTRYQPRQRWSNYVLVHPDASYLPCGPAPYLTSFSSYSCLQQIMGNCRITLINSNNASNLSFACIFSPNQTLSICVIELQNNVWRSSRYASTPSRSLPSMPLPSASVSHHPPFSTGSITLRPTDTSKTF